MLQKLCQRLGICGARPKIWRPLNSKWLWAFFHTFVSSMKSGGKINIEHFPNNVMFEQSKLFGKHGTWGRKIVITSTLYSLQMLQEGGNNGVRKYSLFRSHSLSTKRCIVSGGVGGVEFIPLKGFVGGEQKGKPKTHNWNQFIQVISERKLMGLEQRLILLFHT